jgi:hypothetical protein
MAISAEQLNVILSARDREFSRAMQRSEQRVNRFSKESNKSLSSTSKAFAALATSAKRLGPAIAAALSVQAFRGALAAASEIDNLSRIAGVASDQFQVLALTSQQFGIGQEKLSDILKDVNDKFGDYAQTGAGPLADFFENIAPKVGLTASAFADLSSDQKLGAYINALERANVSQADMTFYMEAIASDSTALVPAFQNNSAAIDEMAKKAADLGLVIDRETIAKSKEAQNELDLMSKVISIQLTQALLSIAPAIAQAAGGIATISAAVREFFQVFPEGNFLPELLDADGLKALAAEYEGLGGIIARIGRARSAETASLAQGNEANAAKFALQAVAAEDELREAIALRQGQQAAGEGAVASSMALGKEINQLREQARLNQISAEQRERETIATQRLARETEIRNQILASGREITDAMEADIQTLGLRFEESAVAASLILTPLKAAKKETKDTRSEAELAKIAYEKLLNEMIAASPALQALGFDADNLQSTMQMVESSMESAFMSMVDGTMSAKDAFRSMAGSIIKELFRVLVVQRLVGGITSALGFPAAPTGAPVVGAASGRSLRSGQPAVVGEHGRELFVPQTAGRVLSVSQAQSAVGGGGSVIVNQTINVSTGVQQTVRTEIKQLMPQIAESAKAAVVDAKRRGGSYGRAFS